MNDYLDTLLACTLRPQETIQPRLRGRYEPLNYSRGLAMAPPLDLTGSETTDLVEEEISQTAPSSPGQVSLAPIGPLAIQPSAPPQTGEIPPASAPKTGFLGAPASPLASGRKVPPVSLEPTPSSVTGPFQAGEDAGAPGGKRLEPTAPSAPKTGFLRAPASPPASGRNTPPLNLEPTPSSVTGSIQAGEDAGAPSDRQAPVFEPVVSPVGHAESRQAAIARTEPLTPAIQPRPLSPAQPRIKPASPHAFGEPSNPRAAEAPTIQVTIGRIEVRATPPAAPVPKSRPASPTLGLDDYLRQRNEGKR